MVSTAKEFFNLMGIRQYELSSHEADDLIYAFCDSVDVPIVIVSSDSDLQQIMRLDHVSIWSPSLNSMVDRPMVDELAVKCLTGDGADSISGYWQIGRSRALEMIANEGKLNDFLDSQSAKAKLEGILVHVGRALFDRNKRLMDLGLNPELSSVKQYVSDIMNNKPTVQSNEIYAMTCKRKLRGFMAEFQNCSQLFVAK
jgi:5'-3' exonuclease